MRCKKSLKFNFIYLLSLLLASLLFPYLNYAQQLEPLSLNYTKADTTTEKPVQYRRGIELNEGYQSYEEKYSGKNLSEEKRRLFPLESTGVWTELNPKVPRVDYLGIQFVNPDTGWAVGDLGALIKSTDGGNSWTVSETNTTTPILKVRSYNGQIVIASGFGGLILRSTDGGETFAQVTSGVTGDLWGLQMINDTLGWACGNGNSLVKTTDGGLNWNTVTTPGYTSDYWWIDFMNESYGFIAANGKILRTTDGGNNWEIIQAGDSYPLFSIDVIDSLQISAAGYGGTGYGAKNIYSSDAGYTWINGGPITTESVNCIKYINPDTGYTVLTEVSARKTTNRGQSWTIIGEIDDNYELQFFEEDNIGYSAGTVLKINKSEGNFNIWNRLILNDTFSDVYFTSETTGYVASRWFYKTTDSGISWTMLPNFPTNLFTSTLGSVAFADNLTGVVGGPPCRIVKTTDAGDTWYLANRTGLDDTIGTTNKIFFINPATGWAVTSRGGILKTTDSGDNWFAQLNAGVSISFNSIYFIDSLNGWTANFDRPFKTTNGGINWVQQTNLNIWNSDDVYFENQDTGWFAIYSSINNSLFRTTDAGLNWFGIPEVIGARKFYIFPDPIHWLTIGFSRYYITNDYGNSWSEFTEDVPTGLISFNAVDNALGYSVGKVGLILRYNDTTYIPVELISFEVTVNGNEKVLTWITASELNNKGFFIEKSSNKINWETIGFVNGHGTTTKTTSYTFTDYGIINEQVYYRLKQVDYNGDFYYSDVIEVIVSNPISFALSQNFPNPFNSTTTIRYQLPVDDFVNLILYDIIGNEVKTFIDENKKAGYYTISLNATDLSSGIYFYKLTAGENSSTRKFLLLK